MLWQRQMLSDPDNFTSLNLEESACLPRLRSGRNPAPKQCKSKQILCLQEAELWKFQPLILTGVCADSKSVPPEQGTALGQLTGFTELET